MALELWKLCKPTAARPCRQQVRLVPMGGRLKIPGRSTSLTLSFARAKLLHMRATSAAFLGVFCFLIAGFVRGMGVNSSDPELVLAASYALAASGALGVLTGGVALGIRLSRS